MIQDVSLTPQPFTSADDAAAHRDMLAHHEALLATLVADVEAVVSEIVYRNAEPVARCRRLVEFLDDELLPHALAEEATIYALAAKRADMRLLVEAMLAEHQQLQALTEVLRTSSSPRDLVVAAGGIATLLKAHVAKENDQLLATLAADPNVSLAALLANMHDAIDEVPVAAPSHHCTCGEHQADDVPVIDASKIAHSIRHATVLGAWSAVRPGHAMELVAPHDPLPLLAQLQEQTPAGVGIEYVERGPNEWRLRLTKSV